MRVALSYMYVTICSGRYLKFRGLVWYICLCLLLHVGSWLSEVPLYTIQILWLGIIRAVYNRWTGLVDWTSGLDW